MPSQKNQKAHTDLCAEALYGWKQFKVSDPFNYLSDLLRKHLPELCAGRGLGLLETSTQIQVRVLKHHDFDERRIWQLATVWYKKKPVMIIQNCGREGDDFMRRFVTDAKRFTELVGHIARKTERALKKANRTVPAGLTDDLNPAAVAVIDSQACFKEITFFRGWDFRDEFPKDKY